MKQYPSIPRKPAQSGSNWYVFDKIDGSNVRAEWSKKQGFYKFGSRKVLLGEVGASEEQTLLGESLGLIRELAEPLSKVFQDQRWQDVVCFFEFYGPGSFAGAHLAEPHKVALLDVHVHKKGLLDVREFLDLFQGTVHTPTLLHQGSISQEMDTEVRNGTLQGMTFEGIVAKAPISKKWAEPAMFKIKNQAWIEKVRALHGEKADFYL